jgi:hypothetical protein
MVWEEVTMFSLRCCCKSYGHAWIALVTCWFPCIELQVFLYLYVFGTRWSANFEFRNLSYQFSSHLSFRVCFDFLWPCLLIFPFGTSWPMLSLFASRCQNRSGVLSVAEAGGNSPDASFPLSCFWLSLASSRFHLPILLLRPQVIGDYNV